jgi:uncharacterized protein YfaA (DUF2138 family)
MYRRLWLQRVTVKSIKFVELTIKLINNYVMNNIYKVIMRVTLTSFLIINFASAEINWGPPDSVISTQSLSDLPKDILKQPMLKEILTDDFAFYYLDSAEFLSLKGSLKRIAFEHELTFADEILNYVMSTPADVIFWKKENGRLDDFMLSIERTNLIDLLTMIGKVAANDKQLSVVEERTEGQDKFKIYKLRYGQHNQLYFTNLGTKLIVFTDPKMPMPTAQRLKTWLKDDLYPSAVSQGGFFSKLFGNEETKNKHQTYLNINFLTFGYQKYLSHIDFMAFSFNDKNGWRTHALLSGIDANVALNTNELWKAVPRSPAMCISLPLNHLSIKELFTKIFADEKFNAVVSSFSKNMGVCWFAESRFYSPVYVLKTEKNIDIAFLEKAFNLSIKNNEKNPSPVQISKTQDSLSMVKFIPSRYGTSSEKKDKEVTKGFKAKMASVGNYIVFSVDGSLVDKSVAVINKKSPALSEALSNKEKVAGVLYPNMLSALMKKSIEESLSASGDTVFKEAFTKRFFPTLKKMNTMPNLSLEWPKDKISETKEWQELSWEKFTSK